MPILHPGKAEEFVIGREIQPGKVERFKLTQSIHPGKQEKFTMATILNPGKQEKFSLISTATNALITGQEPSGSEWMAYIPPEVIPSVTLKSPAGTEVLSDLLRSVTLKKHLGGKTTVDLELVDPGTVVGAVTLPILKRQPTLINPWFVGFQDSQARLIRHNFTARTTVEMSLQWGFSQSGYSSWAAPTLLPLEPKFDGTVLRWELEDFTGLLEKENVSLTDIDADAPPENRVVRSAFSAIPEIASNRGIPNTIIQYRDFPLRLLRRKNGVPLNWIDQINRVRQAKRRFEGSTLVCFEVVPPHLGTPKWTFTAGLHIEAGDFEAYQDMSDYKNKFTVSRSSPQGGIIGEQECIGGQCVGRTGDISLAVPATATAAQIEVTQGYIEDFVYYDGDQVSSSYPIYTLTGSGPTYLGPPITRVKFTYRPEPRATVGIAPGSGAPNTQDGFNAPFVPRYKVTIYGKMDPNVGVSSLYSYTAQDAGQISTFGEWIEYGDIEDPIIADAATLVEFGQALLRESTRKMWYIRFTTKWVNPRIEPGDIIRVNDYSTKIDHNWVVEELTIRCENGKASMQILASRGGV